MGKYAIRDEVPSDWVAIRRVHDLAFCSGGEGKVVDELRKANEAAVSLVAEGEGQIIGHVLLSRIKAPMRALALGPIAIHPEFQGRGIGSSLIREGVTRAKDCEWEIIFVLGSPTYYGEFGFNIEDAKEFNCKYSGVHFMARKLNQAVTRAGKLTYPAPWAILD